MKYLLMFATALGILATATVVFAWLAWLTPRADLAPLTVLAGLASGPECAAKQGRLV